MSVNKMAKSVSTAEQMFMKENTSLKTLESEKNLQKRKVITKGTYQKAPTKNISPRYVCREALCKNTQVDKNMAAYLFIQ